MSALQIISSMATKSLLADLISAFEAAPLFKQHPLFQLHPIRLCLESVGGVDAAKRVEAGEPFDIVCLASDAIERLMAAGHLQDGSRYNLVHSGVAVAVRSGSPKPDITTADAVKAAVLAAPSIGYSTGPSGVALAKCFEQWGIGEAVRRKLVVPKPGIPVGSLIASGEIALGFQQLSELMHLPGIDLLGMLPAPIAINTTFCGAIAKTSQLPDAARTVLQFMAAPEQAMLKQKHGMESATQ